MGDANIVLGVNIDCCEGCADRVYKALRGFEGVEGIGVDAKNKKVTVKGKQTDPVEVAKWLRKKTGKPVELVSPKPKKEEKKKEEKKPQLKVIEAPFTIPLYCEGCKNDVKRWILEMEGVHTVDANMEKNLVTVKGTIDPPKLVEFIKKRSGKHAEIAKPHDMNKDSNKGDDRNKNSNHSYPRELVYAPQLFSDENPNSCSVM